MTVDLLVGTRWVVAALKADSTFNAAVGGRVYADQIPGTITDYPACVINRRSGEPVRAAGNGGVVIYQVETLVVRVVNSGLDQRAAAAAMNRARVLLDLAQNQTVTGGVVLSCVEVQEIPIPSYKVGETPYHEFAYEFELTIQ